MAGDRLRDPRDREARAARILDASAELLLRLGYRRVTVDDIARHADVGKGTVYLHWKTREALFQAVFEREVLAALDELVDALRREPGAWLPHRLARSYFLAIGRRPLLRALFLADAELLGKLARPGTARERRHNLVARAYFESLAEHGVLHDDLTPEAAEYAFLATLEGFIQAEATAGHASGSGRHDRSELLALTVRRAFESGRALAEAEQRVIAGQVIGLFTDLGAADRAEIGIGDS